MATQRWDPATYARHARFVSDLGAGVVELLAPRPGERILDLGCGDGVLTETLVAALCQVLAVDRRAEQIAGARARGLDARVARAESLRFESEFDAVFSNAVLHWIRDADAVLASVSRALKPGGRFVAELGGAGCVQIIREGRDRRVLVEEVRDALEPRLYDPRRGWSADYVRLRFAAERPM